MDYAYSAEYGGITVGVLVDQDDDPWFFAHEVAQAYGARDSYAVTQYIKDQHKATLDVRTIPTFDWESQGGTPKRVIISLKGLFTFMMRGNTPRAVEFQDWVIEELLPAIYNGDDVSLEGTPMESLQEETSLAGLVARIEILVNEVGELRAELQELREDRDYWRTVAMGMTSTEYHIYGDPIMADLINTN